MSSNSNFLPGIGDSIPWSSSANLLSASSLLSSGSSDLTVTGISRSIPLIFIGGMPRSGTTLLRVILDAHPDVRCGEETRVIPRLLGYRAQWMKSPFESRRLQEAGITPEVLDSAISAFILEVVGKHGPPAQRLCNKDPFTLRSAVYLKKLFPNSKFIFMIRDGRAVVHSIITRKMTKWNSAMQAMHNQCETLGPSYCLPVYYEQMVLKPELWLRKILEFLDVPWNDSVLNHEKLIDKPGGISLSKLERSTDQVIKPINDVQTDAHNEIQNNTFNDSQNDHRMDALNESQNEVNNNVQSDNLDIQVSTGKKPRGCKVKYPLSPAKEELVKFYRQIFMFCLFHFSAALIQPGRPLNMSGTDSWGGPTFPPDLECANAAYGELKVHSVANSTIADLLGFYPDFHTTYTIGEKLNWTNQLNTKNRCSTFFAPTEDAWNKLRLKYPTLYEKLIQGSAVEVGKALLDQFLVKHSWPFDLLSIFPGIMTETSYFDIEHDTQLTLKQFNTSSIIVRPDIRALNGYIHGVDTIFTLILDFGILDTSAEGSSSLSRISPFIVAFSIAVYIVQLF